MSQNSFKLHKLLHANLRLENFVKNKKIWYIREYLNFLYKKENIKYVAIQLYRIFKSSPWLIDYIFYNISNAEKNFKLEIKKYEILTKNIEKILENEEVNSVDISKEGDIFKRIQTLESNPSFKLKKINNFGIEFKISANKFKIAVIWLRRIFRPP